MKMTRFACYLIVFLTMLLCIPASISYGYEYTELPGIKGYAPPDPEAWPWEAPYTGEQLVYLAFATRRATGYKFMYPMIFKDQKGSIRMEFHNITEKLYYENYGEKLKSLSGSGPITCGDISSRLRIWWMFPASIRGREFCTWDYFDCPTVRADADRWLYSPNLRRIRRLAGGDRADNIGGSDYSYDDILGREVYEWDYEILGYDYIYPEETSFENKVFETVGWHEPRLDLSPYPKGPDGKSIKCTVVKATPKLPDYYLSQIIYWICEPTEDFPAVDIRYEQYDPEGNLWKIYWRYWQYVDTLSPYTDHKPYYVNGGSGKYANGWRRVWHTQECIHDIQIDHSTYLYFYYWMIPFAKQDKEIREEWLAP